MIGQLRGVLAAKRPNQVLVDVAGVGYEVEIPLSTFYGLPDLRGDVSLLIYTHVREDQITLFGFLSTREKHFFELLLSVSGIGPSVALKVLSGLSTDELIPAVQKGDLAQLTRIPGVGKKTAERIVLELRDKMAALASREATGARGDVAGPGGTVGDVISALLNLGYQRAAVEKSVAAAGKGGVGPTFESLLKAALQQLSKSK
jgi:Holliday junction DNA helicase RuvA